ncbi:PhoX family protein [Vulcanococcus sp.]|jgi:secreted PhoX family phosphatase|uniref:PhoX family protein n=1 Tax=Vulcanococcus sp. TaxID=2856995 RepID=UPI0037DA2B6B
MNRRTLLIQLLGVSLGASAAPALAQSGRGSSRPAPATRLFPPLRGPIPLPTDGLSAAQQQQHYRRIAIDDRVVVPEGYRAELVLSWGDPLGDGRVGFNNDYLAFQPLAADQALLTINFEYISGRTWCAGYSEVTGQTLPFAELKAALEQRGGAVDLASLASDDPLRPLVIAVAEAALMDQGIGVATLQRQADGRWRHTTGRLDRRITGLSGWRQPEQRLRVSGPAAAVFRRRQRLGYNDGLADAVIGSFANCAGGQTPWGSVLSAEENFQSQVVEAVYADGSSPAPSRRPFRFDGARLEGLGNPFGLAGNKYGWMVELDPRRPEQAAVKHSWLGRFRHEAVAVRARRGEPLVVYSGCDRHGGHVYRFVSAERVGDPQDPRNSRLFGRGRLEVAQLSPDGQGRWIALDPATAVNPRRPSTLAVDGEPQAVVVPHTDRSQPGSSSLASDAAVIDYCRRFATLGDLYPGSGDGQQGAILIDAHLAANAIGATPAARPEDTDIDPDTGDLLISFTAGGSDGSERADPAIFRGPAGQTSWPYGWVMRLSDTPAEPDRAGGTFRWRMVATGGTPWQGGMGFSNPDNLAVDRSGTLWMVTDRSTSSAALDIFGNNACWVLPRRGPLAGQALLFATGPMECELCGPCFDAEEATLFLAVQHPGEDHGARRDGAEEFQAFALRDRNGQPIEQLRRVPMGSNWPSGIDGRNPRPGVVMIQRTDGGRLLHNLNPTERS